jgi:hypothetical protein
MNRRDVIRARDRAREFADACDELLALKYRSWRSEENHYVDVDWTETWVVAGKVSGRQRRLSLDLTRALAHMRRRA